MSSLTNFCLNNRTHTWAFKPTLVQIDLKLHSLYQNTTMLYATVLVLYYTISTNQDSLIKRQNRSSGGMQVLVHKQSQTR